MAVAWFIIPYKRDTNVLATRYPAIDDHTVEIESYGGRWSETEVLGNYCIVKVRAPVAVLNALAAIDGYRRLPKDRLDDPLSDLSVQVLKAIKTVLGDMGYPAAEIRERFGNDLSIYTLRDVLKFATRRRLKPRYNAGTGEIILDGTVKPLKPLELFDTEVEDI